MSNENLPLVNRRYGSRSKEEGIGAKMHRNFRPDVIVAIAFVVLSAVVFCAARGWL